MKKISITNIYLNSYSENLNTNKDSSINNSNNHKTSDTKNDHFKIIINSNINQNAKPTSPLLKHSQELKNSKKYKTKIKKNKKILNLKKSFFETFQHRKLKHIKYPKASNNQNVSKYKNFVKKNKLKSTTFFKHQNHKCKPKAKNSLTYKFKNTKNNKFNLSSGAKFENTCDLDSYQMKSNSIQKNNTINYDLHSLVDKKSSRLKSKFKISLSSLKDKLENKKMSLNSKKFNDKDELITIKGNVYKKSKSPVIKIYSNKFNEFNFKVHQKQNNPRSLSTRCLKNNRSHFSRHKLNKSIIN